MKKEVAEHLKNIEFSCLVLLAVKYQTCKCYYQMSFNNNNNITYNITRPNGNEPQALFLA